jgi:hypothetical protein
MRVAFPKPLNGWRAFAGEVGVIVLGVLLALGAQQVAEEVDWRQKVRVVRQSLMSELSNNRARWNLTMVEAKCAIRKLDQIESWAQSGSITPAPAQRQGEAPGDFFFMHMANWELAASSETLNHFPIKEQLSLARLYDGIAHREADIETAKKLAYRVQALISSAGDETARRELQITVGELRLTVASLVSNDAYMERHFDAAGVKADQSDFAADIGRVRC